MTTDNGFQPDRPPIFLTEPLEETGHADIERRLDVAAISSRIFKASALAAVVTTIGVGALSFGNPVLLFASVTDWWNDRPSVQLEADTSASAVPTTTQAQDMPTTADEPAREQLAAVAAPAQQNQTEPVQRRAEPVQVQAESPRPAEVAQSPTEKVPPVSEELFRQFLAWAAEEESRARVGSASSGPARVAQETQQPQPAKKQRRVRSVQNARAEARPPRQQRTRVREAQEAREPIAPAADPRTADPAAQTTQPPTFFQSLGFR